MERGRLQVLVCFGEQGGLAPGVPEEDDLVRAELAFTGEIDQPCSGATGIDRIQQNSFGAGEQMDGFPFGIGQYTVPRRAIVVIYQDFLSGKIDAFAQPGGSIAGKLGHVELQVEGAAHRC